MLQRAVQHVRSSRWAGYDGLAVGLVLATLILVWFTFRDYGITNDEEVQNTYGKMILSYYASGFQDMSALSYKDLFYYGGLFDFVAALLNRFSPLGEYETRHLLGGVVGVLGVLGTWRLAHRLGGPRVGVLALGLLLLIPSYYGPAFNNPKDIPFAVGMLWTLWAVCRLIADFPSPSWCNVALFGVVLGLTLGIRVGAGLAVLYLFIVILFYVGRHWHMTRSGSETKRLAATLIWAMVPAFPVAYAVMAVFWPWSYQSPFNPLIAVQHFSHYGIKLDTLLTGKWFPANHLPADYLPLYLLVKLPELVLLGLLGGVGTAAGRLWRHDLPSPSHVLQLGVLALSILFPLVFFMVERPTAYNGIRHFEFLLPSLAIAAALGLDGAAKWLFQRSPGWGRVVACVFGLLVIVHIGIMASLHPDEYVYFNLLAGGVNGASGNYELDYWSNSLPEATEDLAAYVSAENQGKLNGRTYNVAICGNPLAAIHFMPPYLKFTSEPSRADFFLSFTQHNCDKTIAGRVIIAVKRFGANLSVVKDLRHQSRLTAAVVPQRTVN